MTSADDSVTERKGPFPALSPTSAVFTEFVGQPKRNEWSHKHEFPATASPRNQTSLELDGASSLQKSKKYERRHAVNCDLPPQNQPELDTSLPPSVISLTTSSQQTQDEPSTLSLDSVVRPGFCSPLMMLAAPADMGEHCGLYARRANLPPLTRQTGVLRLQRHKTTRCRRRKQPLHQLPCFVRVLIKVLHVATTLTKCCGAKERRNSLIINRRK
ncbi:uncharacterized protein LOC142765308 isoform X2 [Rhipicephalus microplus]|uniref:uncharacterized protein LOC142765308 isoform X2 n=1 Tax=Rhipicephalus microplus TaxID=6941 RepID=UPI003F6AC91A